MGTSDGQPVGPDGLPIQHGQQKPDLEPQQPGESWSDYYRRTSSYYGKGGDRYPWGSQPWPGTDPPKKLDPDKSLSIHHNDLRKFASLLATELDTFVSDKSGAHANLQQTGSLTPEQVGIWQGGKDFHGTIDAAHTAISNAHGAFLESYKAVVERFLKAAGIFDDAEDEVTQFVHQVFKKAGLSTDSGVQT